MEQIIIILNFIIKLILHFVKNYFIDLSFDQMKMFFQKIKNKKNNSAKDNHTYCNTLKYYARIEIIKN